ncbi:efflux RND transporter permease subunit [Flavobacterium psychrophilum]|uniref:efflux RND transporter permease subunit n=1 Tax=Flavobacterium psychrophilum TaxID=96345 RepID=UPI000B7C51FF|nr:efflux RND transporter permease subunit [Flavobacterium psychrophilum]EKT4501814.1 efflux RND transporter permease subunit [Flavobacterium psychrophilum]ELV7525005.1 efflux RND transporter permease subunit [Flavobacterium psychrophilum]QZL00144.1 efflux RND transporter permease subunit [Flavobacterium psychrophilum]SNB13584.1 putative multidrug resistance protein. AcrB/AcrD/AcrF family protein [Flavobacterium psychrophilum]SNB24254.1 putative multidrug resistance protein. AcrB/AcrD/AcrF fam
MEHKNHEFSISSWAVDNRVTVYILTLLIVVTGVMAYITMPREDFPEIIENKIYISSIFPGNSAEDVEKLIVKPLEKEIKNITGVEKITSSSFQDYGMIVVEFSDNVSVAQAKTKVKDKVDVIKADTDWPNLDNGSKVEPNVFELNISEEVPILNINLQGNYTTQQLKKYGELLQDDIEEIPEVKKVDILGVDDKEVEIAVDIFKMTAAQVSFDEIQNAVKYENMTLSGGNLISQGSRNNIRIVGEIKNPKELENIIVKHNGGTVYLKDIAVVSFKEKEKTTYAREKGTEVVMLNVKKRSNQNMISAIDQVKEKLEKAKVSYLPKDLKLELSNDQSSRVEHQVDELSNHIIFGIVLVMIVLMFTMGLRNSLFVGAAIPLSMMMAFTILSAFGLTLNTMVLFGLVMGLGMLVDDGIVVVDNVFANMKKGMPRIEASKIGIGEIAWPVISSTATTLMAFLPFALWPGTMGKFMKYFPITLTVTLSASLFVAMVVNAAMTGGSMDIEDKNVSKKSAKTYSIVFTIIAVIFVLLGNIYDSKIAKAIGHLAIISLGLMWLYKIKLYQWTQDFQHSFFPRMEEKYKDFLAKILTGKRAWIALGTIIGMLFFSFILLGIFPRKVLFFPDNIPNQVITYIEYPQGTDIGKTNKATLFVEKQVISILSKYVDPKTNKNYLAESIISQVGKGAGNPNVDAGSASETPYKGKVTVNFSEFKFRKGINTADILEEIRGKVKAIAGAKVTVEKDAAGPPAGYPISIQLTGTDYDVMLKEADKMITFINAKNIPGIERLNVDVNKQSPELEVKVDRVSAGSLGVSTGQLGFNLRRSVYGQEISTYKEGDDDYNITMRMQDDQRKNESVLFNQSLTFRNQGNGQMMQVPISAISKTEKTTTYNQIKRKNQKRIMTIYSNVLTGYNGDAITKNIGADLKDYQLPKTVTYSFSGVQEEQGKNASFLMYALFLALAGITIIIVLQFNSVSKTMVILFTVILSFSGVFYGYVIANMDFVILMTMMGIISLAGIVVKNGIVLMDFFVLLLDKKMIDKQVESHDDLTLEEIKEVIIESGKSRLRPVLLTALTAILGLIPLAIGLNFDFFSLITDLNPHIFMGGDNVIFWGPLAWTIIFGLSYATVLTLVMVPVMFYLVKRTKYWLRDKRNATQVTI